MSEATGQATGQATVIYADAEHNGIRVAVPFILFLGLCLGFYLLDYGLSALFPAMDSTVLLACVGALPVGLLLALAGETMLKRVWRSGRGLILATDEIAFTTRPGQAEHIERSKTVNLTLWYFSLSGYPRGGRERRVSANWYCFAGRVQQDDSRLTVYCYASPKQRDAWVARFDFHRIEPAELYDKSLRSRMTLPTRPELPPEVIAGDDGRYWLAERSRWEEGLELTPKDFERLIVEIQSYPLHT